MSDIQIREITDKTAWEQFVKGSSPSIVLQSWNWGQFQKALHRKVWYLGIFEGEDQIGACLCYMIPTKLRTHLYTSNGPIFDIEKGQSTIKPLLDHLKTIARNEGALFVRLDPLIADSQSNRDMLENFGLVCSKTNTQAENRWILDIKPDEETLLANMRKNTRYAIRRSTKEGVTVQSSSDPKDFDKFWPLFLQTVETQKFVPHPKEYFVKQITAFKADQDYHIYWAEHNGKILATALIASYGDTSYYLHAASSTEDKNIFPAHALIWKALLDSKNNGQKYFDFWGIAPTNNPNHQWAGFTFFKTGFGGFRQDVIRAHDIPLSPMYSLVALLEATRRIWGRAYFILRPH